MGESANSDSAIGNYYVETNADFPFAKGEDDDTVSTLIYF